MAANRFSLFEYLSFPMINFLFVISSSSLFPLNWWFARNHDKVSIFRFRTNKISKKNYRKKNFWEAGATNFPVTICLSRMSLKDLIFCFMTMAMLLLTLLVASSHACCGPSEPVCNTCLPAAAREASKGYPECHLLTWVVCIIFLQPPPVIIEDEYSVTSITPKRGPVQGGTRVVISGSGFNVNFFTGGNCKGGRSL